jgi:hypothetical protein
MDEVRSMTPWQQIFEIKHLRDTWREAKNGECVCEGVHLQINGHCTCGRQMDKDKAKAKLMKFILEL